MVPGVGNEIHGGLLPETTTAHQAQYLMYIKGMGTPGEIRLQRTDPLEFYKTD